MQKKSTPFKSSFYIANVMEIFERFAWYGMYTMLALYLTTPKEVGGLGFDQSEKGIIMGLVPFFLYLFPIVSGAMADRFGYKKMFLLSFLIMAPSYYLLGQVEDMKSFLAVFLLVGLGAGIFKPVVTGTIGRTTDSSNRGLGFGIFYMMVNIGGALGPLIAPIIQKTYGWEWVFNFAAIWILLNFIPIIFYKEPVSEKNSKSISQIFYELQSVLGNARLALLVFPLLILLVAYNANLVPSSIGYSSVQITLFLTAVLIVGSFIWDSLVKNNQAIERKWYQEKMKLGNKSFIVYLLILSGFWTVYLQLFITLPSYTRDFVDTSDLVSALHSINPWLYNTFAGIDLSSVNNEIQRISLEWSTSFSNSEPNANLNLVNELNNSMKALDLRVPTEEIQLALSQVANQTKSVADIASVWSNQYRQINPSTLLSLDFIMIVVFQLIISSKINRFKVLPTLIFGTFMISLSMTIGGLSHTLILGGWLVATSIIVFAVGEMIASPKSQEYVASFAPKDQVAMFMGYYFVSLALGNLFAGIMSGWLYQDFAIQQNNPELMWMIIALLGLLTCSMLYLFSQKFTKDISKQQANAE